MHGGVPAEATEIGVPHILPIQFRIADVDPIERKFLSKLRVFDGD
jgi:hypothetical protein